MKQVAVKRPRRKLSTKGLIATIRSTFENNDKFPHIRGNRKDPQTLIDIVMSGFAMFSLKHQSLLQFDQQVNKSNTLRHNLLTLYGIKNVPSDTYMRERLDEVDPKEFRKLFTTLFTEMQRGKELESFQYLNGHYLMSIDGTGFFSSDNISCDNCCEAHHKDGRVTHSHKMLCAAIVHPNKKTVIPLAPEPIMKNDGKTKNDCERNANKRLLADFRREHPHLKVIALGDALHANGPNIKKLNEHNMRFILGIKPGSHTSIFEFTDRREGQKDICKTLTFESNDGYTYEIRYLNNLPLNDSHPDLMVNFLDCVVTENREINENDIQDAEANTEGESTKKSKRFTFVTDIPITLKNVAQLVTGGRTRWKIENEVFNTLKNQGYQFEHNFGHGKKNLSTVFCMLMMLAFTVDQIQEQCDLLFQQALAKAERKLYLWRELKALFDHFKVSSWSDMWSAIAYGFEAPLIILPRAGP